MYSADPLRILSRVKRLLFVDDEGTIRQTLSAILTSKGFEVVTAPSVSEALELVNTQHFDVLLSDLNIGEPGDGFTVVSAMRRVQPHACTFILTGYPDFESALRAIRSQVDDYFAKPADVDALVDRIQRSLDGGRGTRVTPAVQRVPDVLRELLPQITEQWLERVEQNPELSTFHLSRTERSDHIPNVIDELVRGTQQDRDGDPRPQAIEAAQQHGRTRQRQGYAITDIVTESRILQQVLTATVQQNLLRIELSTLIHDMMQIGEQLNALLEVSIRAYQSQTPTSLQDSFSMLYRSAHLGVSIANEGRIVDANDALLRMIDFSREEMKQGLVDWQALTPPEYLPLDMNAIEQIRQYGVCVPFEKEYILRDGHRFPFMIGAVRLSREPLQWAAYVVDLSEHRRALAAEQRANELHTQALLVNQLAHEINNPLAALTFLLHLLNTHPDVPQEVKKLVTDATDMLDRISGTVRTVLGVAGDGQYSQP
jgi:PAS domain S-box-containing protein